MGDMMSFGQQAYELYMKFPVGLMGPEVVLLTLQNRVNETLKTRGLEAIKLESASDLLDLPEPAAKAALDIIKTMRQMSAPKEGDIAPLL